MNLVKVISYFFDVVCCGFLKIVFWLFSVVATLGLNSFKRQLGTYCFDTAFNLDFLFQTNTNIVLLCCHSIVNRVHYK